MILRSTFIWVLFTMTFGTSIWSQDKKIDKLEIFYDQGYYRKVLRKSERLLDKPDYDYSAVPKLYKALSLFQLLEDEHYQKKHPQAFQDARRNFEIFINQDINGYVYTAHHDKILEIQVLLAKKSLKLKNKGREKDAQVLSEFISSAFKDKKSLEELAMLPVVEEVGIKKETTEKRDPKDKKDKNSSADIKGKTSRDEIIDYAKTFLGVKYKYGGTDEKGFDCSGYTGFVMKQFDVFLPRTSGDQYNTVKKIKKSNVQKGDLVFFGGNNINHVGIVYSDPGEPIHMIHASTSVGISIVNIESSSYWKPRIKGYGRVIKE